MSAKWQTNQRKSPNKPRNRLKRQKTEQFKIMDETEMADTTEIIDSVDSREMTDATEMIDSTDVTKLTDMTDETDIIVDDTAIVDQESHSPKEQCAKRQTSWKCTQNMYANKQVIEDTTEEPDPMVSEHSYGSMLRTRVQEPTEQSTMSRHKRAQQCFQSAISRLREESTKLSTKIKVKQKGKEPPKVRHVPNILKRQRHSPPSVTDSVQPQFYLVQECSDIQKAFLHGRGMTKFIPTEDGNFIIEEIDVPESQANQATFAPGGTASEVPASVVPLKPDDRSKKLQILEHGLYQWLCGSPHWKMNSIWCDGRFRVKAKQLAQQLSMDDFEISQEWMTSFKTRHGVTEENSKGIKKPPWLRKKVSRHSSPNDVSEVDEDVDAKSEHVSESDEYAGYSDDNYNWMDDSDEDIGSSYQSNRRIHNKTTKPQLDIDKSFDINSEGGSAFDDIDNVITAAVDRIDEIIRQNENVMKSDAETPDSQVEYNAYAVGDADVAQKDDVQPATDVVIKTEPIDVKLEDTEKSSDYDLNINRQLELVESHPSPRQQEGEAESYLVNHLWDAVESTKDEELEANNETEQVAPSETPVVLPPMECEDNSDRLLVIMHDAYVASEEMKDRAWKTVPDGLYIRLSNIQDMKDGVFTAALIPNGVCFGPYEGEIMAQVDMLSHGCVWKIYSGGRLLHYLDGQDTTKANWMKFVRSTSDTTKQNLEVFQHEENIYFRTTTDICPSVELLMPAEVPLKYSIYSGDGTLNYYTPYNDIDGVCSVCGQNLGTAIAIETHPLFHKGICPYDCLTCGACFVTLVELKNHKRTEHPEVSPFICINCPSWFSRTSYLVRHSMIHLNVLRCSVCGSVYKNQRALQTHMNQEHVLSQKHFCDVCHVQFSTFAKLQRHTEKHKQIQLKCIKCKMSFTAFSELMAHRKIHRIYKTNMQKSIKQEEVDTK